MSVVVQKYGGVCLGTPQKIRAAAQAIHQQVQEGHKLIVVVSAMGKTTDELVNLAYQVSPQPNRRELDMLLSTGERVSMSLLSMALEDLGCAAISFTGSQAGVMTDGSHSNARIMDIRPIRVQEELSRGRVIVLAGFQGVNPETKEITTLGRGGSDTTAVAMAIRLGADRCEIIKEVNGVCTADPKIVPVARSHKALSYGALAEMCFWGAKILHFRSVELAMRAEIPLVIKNINGGPSTLITKEVLDMENEQILSINSHPLIEHLQIEAATLNKAFEIFDEHLHAHKLARPQVLASAYEKGAARLMLTGEQEALAALLRSLTPDSPIKAIKTTLSSVTITCHGSVGSRLTTVALKKLSDHSIHVDKLVASPSSVTFVVQPSQREPAIKALHQLIEA